MAKKKKSKSKNLDHAKFNQLYDAKKLREFVNFSRGDPLLTAWEEHFLAGLSQKLYNYVGSGIIDCDFLLSEKQMNIIDQLKQKLKYDPINPPLVSIPVDFLDDSLPEYTDPNDDIHLTLTVEDAFTIEDTMFN